MLEIEAAQSWKPHIENQAARPLRTVPDEKILRARERLGAQSHGLQQSLDRDPYRRVVINDKDGGRGGRIFHCHQYAPIAVGKVKLKMAPRSDFGVAHRRPPWDSIIVRLIANPMPVP